MGTISENVRKATTFLLAVFLWLHALFFVNIQSPLIAKFTQLLRLTTAEFVLFALLVILSFLAASGFWKTLLSLTYIYCFPFVLLGYVFYCCFLILRAMNRWFKAQAIQQTGNVRIIEQNAPAIVPAPSASPDIQA